MRILCILVLCVSFLTACQPTPDPLRIGSNRWLGYGPIYLADELGWATSSNIRLIEYPSANGVIRGMQNGLLDAGFLTLDEAIILQSTGQNIEIILISNLSAGADVLYAKPSIRKLEQLKGARIAIESNTLGPYFIYHTLDQANLSLNDIEVINLPNYLHLEALQTGSIDAMINTSAVHEQALAAGMLPLFSSRNLPEEIIDVLVVNRERISPELRRRIQALWYSSLDAWLEQRPKSDKLLYKRLGINESTLNITLDGMVMGDQALNAAYFNQGVLANRINTMQRFMLDKKLLKHPIDTSQLLPQCSGNAC
ncbi:MAG: ABC transporter substrate-binding protein [Gammaproteobacteria bacterium]|nr:ABC transporter substrate-binding protein [Gammaproteobacteria bacterium]